MGMELEINLMVVRGLLGEGRSRKEYDCAALLVNDIERNPYRVVTIRRELGELGPHEKGKGEAVGNHVSHGTHIRSSVHIDGEGKLRISLGDNITTKAGQGPGICASSDLDKALGYACAFQLLEKQ